MKNLKKLLALLLALAMVLSLAACGGSSDDTADNTGDDASDTSEETGDTGEEAGDTGDAEAAETSNSGNNTLIIGQDAWDGKFSPFFYTGVADEDIIKLVHEVLFSTDRTGTVVQKGIEGETIAYNGTDYTYYGIADMETVENDDGTVDYNITLKPGVYFSDGVEMTIDDVIFNMYVLSDPTYDGSQTFFSLPIEGMTEYRSNMQALFDLLVAAGQDNTDFTYWDEATQTAFWADLAQAGEAFAQEIVDYCMANYADYGAVDVATSAELWGFSLEADATAADFFNAMVEAYGGDYATLSSTESAGSSLFDLMEGYTDIYSAGISTGESADHISGIIKTGDYSMTVRMTEEDATAILQFNIFIAPMHYYGDESLYDYDNNSFGFPKGDLSGVKSVTSSPIGAGPYTFVSDENGVVTIQANPNYWQGAPKIEYVKYQFVSEADKVTGVQAGTLDAASPSLSTDVMAELAAINGTDDFDGDVITLRTTQYLGYGYIGINANTVSVGGDGSSDASKNLRRAIATVLSVYRDVVIDSYYGELAEVINYPISNTSWAAPQVTDEGYAVAFSTDVNGDPIYTDGMSDDEKYAAALDAALGFFEAAGYTVENGALTAAPDGAKLEYELIVPGGGTGDHPNFMIISMASDALATIGFNLKINDVSDGTVTIGNKLEAGTAEMWTMAWSASADPDMYQIYYADVANGGANPGGSNNYYAIKDAELDELILAARASLDQSYRKILYKQALDIIVSWACEVPVYQRTDGWVFSTERINTSTLIDDMTPFYTWWNGIVTLELN